MFFHVLNKIIQYYGIVPWSRSHISVLTYNIANPIYPAEWGPIFMQAIWLDLWLSPPTWFRLSNVTGWKNAKGYLGCCLPLETVKANRIVTVCLVSRTEEEEKPNSFINDKNRCFLISEISLFKITFCRSGRLHAPVSFLRGSSPCIIIINLLYEPPTEFLKNISTKQQLDYYDCLIDLIARLLLLA